MSRTSTQRNCNLWSTFWYYVTLWRVKWWSGIRSRENSVKALKVLNLIASTLLKKSLKVSIVWTDPFTSKKCNHGPIECVWELFPMTTALHSTTRRREKSISKIYKVHPLFLFSRLKWNKRSCKMMIKTRFRWFALLNDYDITINQLK